MTIETELPAVKVRELEWNAEPPYHVARGNAGGHYSIERVDSHVVYFELRGNSIWPIKRFASMTEAKAAAQSDYERRILSALVPSTPAEPVTSEELSHFIRDKAESHKGMLQPDFWPWLAMYLMEEFSISVKPSDDLKEAEEPKFQPAVIVNEDAKISELVIADVATVTGREMIVRPLLDMTTREIEEEKV